MFSQKVKKNSSLFTDELFITVNYRLNAVCIYLKIQNFKGAFIREWRLIKWGVYSKMHKFRKQK